MNKIDISGEPPPARKSELVKFANLVFILLGIDNWVLSIHFCNDEFIRRLNKTYRNIDDSTDVLSFEIGEYVKNKFIAGDIVISTDTLIKNSIQFSVPPGAELKRLIIHGILHLNGMDHETNDETEEMLLLQESILQNDDIKQIELKITGRIQTKNL
jgi:probable rRNA maturation factor